jgi:hypothetical protein
MKAVVYRWNRSEGHKSWRPRSLTDIRGADFPDDYHEVHILEADSVDQALDLYSSRLGDIIFLGEGETLLATPAMSHLVSARRHMARAVGEL